MAALNFLSVCVTLSFLCAVSATPIKRVKGTNQTLNQNQTLTKDIIPITCKQFLINLRKDYSPHTKIIQLRSKTLDKNSIKIRYRCARGTSMGSSRKQATRICTNGTIVGKSVSKCKVVKCNSPSIANATFNGTKFTYGGIVKMICNQGYKMVGKATRRCKLNGRWTKKPRCVKIILKGCPVKSLKMIFNANITTSDPKYKHGTKLSISCKHGYELIGNRVFICHNGKWSNRWPYCKAIVCPDPTKYHKNGRIRARSFRVNGTVTFFCNAGFKLLGSKTRTCQKNKLWSGTNTVCDSGNNYCPEPGTPYSGKKVGRVPNRYHIGSLVRFRCNDGYVLIGSPVRRCMASRQWNGTEAICMDEFEYMTRNSKNTAKIFKKNLDRMMEHTCSSVDKKCNLTDLTDLRGRAINPKHVGGLDIVFVFDASSSIAKSDFKLGIRFAKELVVNLGATWKPGGTHVAALTFGSSPHLEFNLGDASTNTVQKVINKLSNIRQSGGGTATKPALDLVSSLIVPQVREGSQKTLFFITDGRSNIGGKPERAAKRLREEHNFEIYAVGVGKKVKHRELMSIASEPEDEHVLVVKEFEELSKMVQKAIEIKIDYTPCGESPSRFSRGRMIGGNKAGRNSWPWQVGIHIIGTDGNLKLKCGGALINDQWILTAAHCFYNGKVKDTLVPQSYTVRVGDYHLLVKENSQEEIPADAIYLHEKYKHSTYNNDIAIVRLQKKVKFGPFVRTLCLPKKGQNLLQVSESGIVAGWGATDILNPGEKPQNSNSDVLLHSEFTIQSDVKCKNATKFFYNPNAMFCAGDGKGGNDTCQGDSGGSFIRQAKDDQGEWRWFSAGLVSWGWGCGLKGHYGYYTKLEPFVEWIEKTMQKDKEDSARRK